MSAAFGACKAAGIEGTTLAYQELGQGEPVVFVHGDLSDLRTWKSQLQPIGARHRVIAYSRRYARPNDDIPGGMDNQMLTHVEDLALLLRALDAVPAHLVGNSWGAFICLLTAMRHPELVRTLVLAEPPALTLFVSMPPRPSELLRLLLRRPRTATAIVKFGATTIGPAEKAFRGDDDDAALRAFVGGVLGAERFERLPDVRREQMRENLSALKASLLGAGFPPLADSDVRGVRQRTLLISGADSPVLFQRLADRLQALLPNCTRVRIPDASHLMHEENPAATNEAILSFLATAG
ncbi:MAG: hypothetical protein NVSMB51_03850 [Solirubrobacteraceae bacterium]